MGRVSKEQQWRLEGMSYAYHVAKGQGMEVLEKDMKQRKAIGIPIPISEGAIEEAAERMKKNTLDTVMILSAYVLYELHGWSKTQVEQYIDNMERESRNIANLDEWQNYIDLVAEKIGINLSIRKNGW